MRGASISTALGLALLSVAILAASTGLAGGERDEIEDQFAAMDRNGDGHISSGEARAASAGLATHFDKFDRDDDGTLSLSEYRRHVRPEPVDG